MQTVYEIIEEVRFSEVTFYSVKSENESLSLFQDFVTRIRKLSTIELERIKQHIQFMGMYGAKEERFRPEKNAHAIPVFETKKHLRLYALRISDEIVFLFNGDFKTAQKAQDCPNVYPHFRLANLLSEKITNAIIQKDIKVDFENKSLLTNPDFILEL